MAVQLLVCNFLKVFSFAKSFTVDVGLGSNEAIDKSGSIITLKPVKLKTISSTLTNYFSKAPLGGPHPRSMKVTLNYAHRIFSKLKVSPTCPQGLGRGYYFMPFSVLPWQIPENIYLFKVNSRNSSKRCEMCSTLRIKTPEWRRSDVFIIIVEHISHLFLLFLLFILNK